MRYLLFDSKSTLSVAEKDVKYRQLGTRFDSFSTGLVDLTKHATRVADQYQEMGRLHRMLRNRAQSWVGQVKRVREQHGKTLLAAQMADTGFSKALTEYVSRSAAVRQLKAVQDKMRQGLLDIREALENIDSIQGLGWSQNEKDEFVQTIETITEAMIWSEDTISARAKAIETAKKKQAETCRRADEAAEQYEKLADSRKQQMAAFDKQHHLLIRQLSLAKQQREALEDQDIRGSWHLTKSGRGYCTAHGQRLAEAFREGEFQSMKEWSETCSQGSLTIHFADTQSARQKFTESELKKLADLIQQLTAQIDQLQRDHNQASIPEARVSAALSRGQSLQSDCLAEKRSYYALAAEELTAEQKQVVSWLVQTTEVALTVGARLHRSSIDANTLITDIVKVEALLNDKSKDAKQLEVELTTLLLDCEHEDRTGSSMLARIGPSGIGKFMIPLINTQKAGTMIQNILAEINPSTKLGIQ